MFSAVMRCLSMPYETDDDLLAKAARKYRPDAPHPPPTQDWDSSFRKRHWIPAFLALFVMGVLVLSITLCSLPPPGGKISHPYGILERKVEAAFEPSAPVVPRLENTTADIVKDPQDGAQTPPPPAIKPYDMKE